MDAHGLQFLKNICTSIMESWKVVDMAGEAYERRKLLYRNLVGKSGGKRSLTRYRILSNSIP